MDFISVDFPAPFGPRSPTISFFSMLRLMLFSAVCSPNFLVRLVICKDIVNSKIFGENTKILQNRQPTNLGILIF